MKLTNNQIYSYSIKLEKAFSDDTQKLPVKINFYLQKNKNTLLELAESIESTRNELFTQYGTFVEDKGYEFSEENMVLLNKEIEELASLEQEVNIYMVNIDTLPDDIILTTAQMDALMFMIE